MKYDIGNETEPSIILSNTGERAGSLGLWGVTCGVPLNFFLSLQTPWFCTTASILRPRTRSSCYSNVVNGSGEEGLGRKKGEEAPSDPQQLLALLADQLPLWKHHPAVHFEPKKKKSFTWLVP